MIDAREISADVRAVESAGAGLGKELLDIITEGIMQNAALIRDFAPRKKELLDVNGEFLFWFSRAVCLYFAKVQESWDEVKTTSVFEDLKVVIARSFRYTSEPLRSDEDSARYRQERFANLQSIYEHVSTSFDRVTTGELFKEGDEKATDALFTLNMLYLTQAYPGSAKLFCSLSLDELRVLSQILGAFGVAVWSARRHLRWES